MTEDHIQIQHVTDHIVEDHDPQYHMTIEDYVKNYPEEQNVTSDQHTMLVG